MLTSGHDLGAAATSTRAPDARVSVLGVSAP